MKSLQLKLFSKTGLTTVQIRLADILFFCPGQNQVFHMEVSTNGGNPIAGWFLREILLENG